jgi:hypothetical protein
LSLAGVEVADGMDHTRQLTEHIPPANLLGYLNFSDGRPDAKFLRALNEAFGHLARRGDAAPWETLRTWLFRQCDLLQQAANPAFADTTQARAALRLAFGNVLTAYRQHHADLLAHQTDSALFTPIFLGRVCEAVLAQGPPWSDDERITAGAVQRLNDFVGYRPIALLETRPQTEFYAHEKFRPVPLHVRGAGTGVGPYEFLIEKAVEVLSQTDASILLLAGFDLGQLDELAMDPRSYDHSHPANRRPNYLFGQWDPHAMDRHGRFTRFVVRQAVLDALLESQGRYSATQVGGDRETNLRDFTEPATVLAGTILMAAGMSGDGPEALDSTNKLATLVPHIARYRDEFYQFWIDRIVGEIGERLRAEAKRVRQPFGGIRQHLNHALARQRAVQLQERRLAMLFAELGFPEASRDRARRIPTTSLRFLGEIRVLQTNAAVAIRGGELRSAAAMLPEIERLIERGIDCGALADPWNIIGYQGLFPLFQSKEDSVHDARNEELIDAVGRQFDLFARLQAGAAFAGEERLRARLSQGARRLAEWWDRFAAHEVSDVPRLCGAERAAAAEHVADALFRWRGWKQNPVGSEMQFWRAQREGFDSTAAFGQVVEALLRERDWNAALALLMTWLSESEIIALDEGNTSFADLAERWIDGVVGEAAAETRGNLLRRFLELLEVNAGERWNVPELPTGASRESADATFESAYEGVSFRDSADDGEEGAVAGGGEPADSFLNEEEANRLDDRLGFIAAVARIWYKAASAGIDSAQEQLAQAARTARLWQRQLLKFLHDLLDIEISAPAGATEDVIEFNERREIRDELAESALSTHVDVSQAVWTIAAVVPESTDAPHRDWEKSAIALERALAATDPAAVRRVLPDVAERLAAEPLLFVPLAEGGQPAMTLRARTAMAYLESLLVRLPHLGLLRETYHVLRLAKTMEQNGPFEGPRKSDFDRLFRTGLRQVVETLLDAAVRWDADRTVGTTAFTDALRQIARSFLGLWAEHSQVLRLSTLEAVNSEDDWRQLRGFIRKYGRPLFTSHFMILGNLRGVLRQGVGAWLDSLRERGDAAGPTVLLEDLDDGKLDRPQVLRWIELVLHIIEEHYEEYRDYNTTTTQSDYGDNLAVLIDLLRTKMRYDRLAWGIRPLVLAHEVLCRKGHHALAEHWRANIEENLRERADELLTELTKKEDRHALRLRTIRDRLEERFAQPLRLDRICALVEPAAREARAGQGETGPAFRLLEAELHPFMENPIGVGLDVPHWLRRFEAEVEKILVDLDVPPTPKAGLLPLTHEDFQAQLTQWDSPLTGA